MFSHVLHNFWLKIFSLGLATMIWVTVKHGISRDFALTNPTMNQTSRQRMKLPVCVIAQPGDGRVFKISPKEIIATIDGEEPILRRMSAKEIKIYVDLTDLRATGVTNGELRADAPKDVTIVDLNPAAVSIEQVSP
jgi:YbbR domain-containing protein